MHPNLTMPLTFLMLTGCAASALQPVSHLRPTPGVPEMSGRPAPPAARAAPATEASRVQLELPTGSAFESKLQVAELRQAITLYTQFLDRARGRPELEPAVRKARERIADAEQTIIFLTRR
jgi:hypothetical protein